MKLSLLASGSKGNSCYVETKETKILIDIGISALSEEKRLIELGIDPNDIDAIIITHSHVDHIDGIKVFSKKHKVKVYLTPKIKEEMGDKCPANYEYIDKYLMIKDLKIITFKTSHDTEDSNAYILENDSKSAVYITDTGYINKKNHKILENRNIYVFESNHDIDMLMNNDKYPYHIKQRILGDKGHLSNVDSSYYLSKFIGPQTQYIILAHLSEQNNTEELALLTLKESLERHNKHCENVLIGRQNEITELIEI